MTARWLIAAIAAVPAGAPQELPVYPGTVHTRVGDDLIINGEHFRIAYFTTRDPLTRVADYFFQEWKRRGLPTSVDGDFRTEIAVSAFYTRDGLQRSVVLRSHGGKTVGFAVLRDLWLRATSVPGPEWIAPEGALFSQSLLTGQEAGGQLHLSALLELNVIAASMEVRDQLLSRGFTLIGENWLGHAAERGSALDHARGAERVHTLLTAVDAGLTAMVQTWAPAPVPEASAPSSRESRGRGEWK